MKDQAVIGRYFKTEEAAIQYLDRLTERQLDKLVLLCANNGFIVCSEYQLSYPF